VDDLGRRHVPEFPAGRCQTIAEIDLLSIHKVPFVERADLVECGAAEQQGCALDDFHAARRHYVPAVHRVGGARTNAFEEEQPPQLAAGGQHRVCGRLQRAVGVEQPRPARARSRVGIHECDQGSQRTRPQYGVAVQQQDVAALRQRNALVIRPREAHVLTVLDQPYPWKPLPNHPRAAVGRRVVHEDSFRLKVEG